MKPRLPRLRSQELIRHFSRARVLVIGDIMVDHFIWGRVSRISPEAPVPVVDVHSDRLHLGGSANVAHNIFSMGGRVCVAGVVGEDEMGQRLIREFVDRGIDPGGIFRDTSRPTTLKTRIVAHGQQVVRFDRENRAPLAPALIENLLRYMETLLGDLGAIVVSDYNKGLVTETLLDGLRSLVKGRGIAVCVDPKRNDFAAYRHLDIITPNHLEAERALGIESLEAIDDDQERALVSAVERLLKAQELRALLITRGEAGMSLFEREGGIRHTRLSTEAKEVYDVTGAGDTVIGVFALAVAAGATFREAAILANHAAGIVVGKAGTATVSQDELKRVL